MRNACLLALLVLPCAAGDDPIAARMDEIRATPDERRWRHIPFETSFATALTKAKERNAPVFYFAADGVLDAGNC